MLQIYCDEPYHPYLGILAFVDQSDEFRIARMNQFDRHRADQEAFVSACNRYRDLLNDRENKIHLGESREAGPYAKVLYRPACGFAFGHTDSVFVTLSDLFDPLFMLSQESEISFEQLSLAFCPKIDCLGISEGAKRWMEEPHELIQATQFQHENLLPVEATPLLFVTRLKLSGVAKLATGSDMTLAVLKAISEKLAETVELVCDNHSNGDVIVSFPSVKKWHCENQSVPFRCSIFESQGVAELTLVMRCNNYALPTLVLHHLRSLTISDALEQDPKLTGKTDDFACFVAQQIKQAKNLDFLSVASVLKNHLFAASYSTACIDLEAIRNAKSRPEGYVGVDVNWVVSPGHLRQVSKLQNSLKLNHLVHDLEPQEHYEIRFGKFDLECRIGASNLPVMHVYDFVKHAERICDSIHGSSQGGMWETGILDMSCVMSVPIPKFLAAKESENHFPLAHLHSIISQGSGREFIGTEKVINDSHRWYRRQELESNLRAVGMPRRLRDSIVYLFTNFLVCLNDPKLFDSILDLHDAFRTTYSLFKHAAEDGYRVTSSDLDDIESHATALEDACYYRLCMASPQHEMNDLAVHFRGGLNSLLNGADVFLKVGAGIVKWICKASSDNSVQVFSNSGRFGAVTELCFSMQPRCKPCYFAIRNLHALAHLKLNLGHVFHINEAVYYMHEMGHVLQRLIADESEDRRRMLEAVDRQLVKEKQFESRRKDFIECLEVWRREIFAEAFVFAFVCGFDLKLFISQYLSAFSSQPDRNPSSTLNVKRQVLEERLVVAFFATNLLNQDWESLDTPDEWEKFTKQQIDSFVEQVQPLGRLHVYAETVLAGDSSSAVFWDEFCRTILSFTFTIASALGPWIREIRTHFEAYHAMLFSNVIPEDSALPEQINMLQQIDESVRKSISEGIPVNREIVSHLKLSHRDGCDHLMLLCSSMIRTYLRLGLEDETEPKTDSSMMAIHARRNRRGKLVWPPITGSPARFMLDQGFAGYITARHQDRGDAIRWAAAIHKSLQGFSNELRLRRLTQMLDQSN